MLAVAVGSAMMAPELLAYLKYINSAFQINGEDGTSFSATIKKNNRKGYAAWY
jgi:hypothetical protein